MDDVKSNADVVLPDTETESKLNAAGSPTLVRIVSFSICTKILDFESSSKLEPKTNRLNFVLYVPEDPVTPNIYPLLAVNILVAEPENSPAF